MIEPIVEAGALAGFVIQLPDDAPEPEELRFTFVRDGTRVHQDSLPFAFEAFRPNGPRCEPICWKSSPVEISLP